MPDYEEYCFECEGYGDDYYIDADGELVCACDCCWVRAKMIKEIEKEENEQIQC